MLERCACLVSAWPQLEQVQSAERGEARPARTGAPSTRRCHGRQGDRERRFAEVVEIPPPKAAYAIARSPSSLLAWVLAIACPVGEDSELQNGKLMARAAMITEIMEIMQMWGSIGLGRWARRRLILLARERIGGGVCSPWDGPPDVANSSTPTLHCAGSCCVGDIFCLRSALLCRIPVGLRWWACGGCLWIKM